ncbi:ATP-binding protein [Streptomyces sp. NPDC088354]|uniref:ATP-binding protein n=1 Tax=Streptomyces sp. NPDC088354 TaxID=3365856 RepID=UPI00380D5EC8
MTSNGHFASDGQSQEVHLDVHPSVVFKLGEDLISDSMQALAELVKNSYDADATRARVTIWTGLPQDRSDPTIEDRSFLRVEDNGSGMDVDDIIRGWLTISNSRKREMKLAGRETRMGRTPLGDKGLGRLGAQRLGQVIEIITRPIGSDEEHQITIDWESFNNQGSLSSVPLRLISRPSDRKHGTTLTIYNLREPEQWMTSASDGQSLQRELSVLISPYGKTRGFRVFLTIDDAPVDLYSLSTKVREAADYRFEIDYHEDVLNIHGVLKLDLLAPPQGAYDDRLLFQRLIMDDAGKSFWKWLQVNRSHHVDTYGWEPAEDNRYFLAFHHTERLSSIGGVATAEGHAADPGPFTGEIDSLDLGADTLQTFNSRSEFRSYVKNLSGIRVYRDGFGIRMDGDWLGLRKASTSGASYYSLKPENTLGFVDITAKNNSQLTETTDREGFADTPAYRNFRLLLQTWRGFADKLQEALRRSYNAYRAEFRAAEARVEPGADAELLLQRVDQRITTVVRARHQLNSLRAGSRATVENANRVREELDGDQASFASMAMSPDIASALDGINRAHERANSAVSEIEELLDSLEAERAVIQLLRDQAEQVREQLTLTWETVSLGLTAEAISHEVATIAEGITVRTGQIKRHVQVAGAMDQRMAAYFQFMQSTSSALKRQLAHLNPSLRYMRERREKIGLSTFCAEVAEYYRARWMSGPLTIEVDETVDDFSVSVNKGKLTQIFDNLILNSEYWLLHDRRLGLVASPTVRIQIRAPFVLVSDNGQGINPVVERTLFEPFVSSKGRGEGRGLGLYVITQLLDSEHCSVSLTPQRNEQGRLYTFALDLGGMRVN